MTAADDHRRPRDAHANPRERQAHAMRWIMFATIHLLAFASVAAVMVNGASVWTAVLAIPVTAVFWLLRILFAP